MTCREMTSSMTRCDESAWEAFHQQYFDWLTGQALSRCSSNIEASEVVQLTFLRAVRHIKVFDDETAFKNWLCCLMRCVVIDLARQTKRRNLLLEKFSHWQESKFHSLDSSSTDYGLNDALDTLPYDDAQLIRMKYLEGWSTRELAGHRETTPKAVESRLARLRKQLKTRLTENKD